MSAAKSQAPEAPASLKAEAVNESSDLNAVDADALAARMADEAVGLADGPAAADAIEQMVKEATEPSQSGIKPGAIITDEDGDGIPRVVSSVESAGYVTLYRNDNGAIALVNRNMLPQTLKKKFGSNHELAGRLVFSPTPLVKPAPPGSIVCLLHKDSPRRAEFNLVGLPSCMKSGFVTQWQMEGHMKTKHKQEYKNVTEQDERQDADEARQLTKLLLKAQLANLTGADAQEALEATRE